MKHSLNLALSGLLATGAFIGLQQLTIQSFRFPLTTTSFGIPIFGFLIAIFLALPVDLIICMACVIGYVIFGLFSIVYIFVTMIKLIISMWRGY
jgi:hypothetical protein